MLLVLVNYTHMTCFYADPNIIKSIHDHQRYKRHTEKFTVHLLYCKSASSREIMCQVLLAFVRGRKSR